MSDEDPERPYPAQNAEQNARLTASAEVVPLAESIEMLRVFLAIRDARHRAAVIALARNLAPPSIRQTA